MVLPGAQKVNQHTTEASPVINGGQKEPSPEALDKRFSSYMEKEIFEQPDAIERTMEGRVDFEKKSVILRGIEPYREEILRCRRMILIGSGSSYHCAIATRQIIEELTELPVMVELASDFLDREVPIFRDDVCVFISQSGETHETIEALKYCNKRDALSMGITNTVNSTLSRETHCGIHANAGIEIGVASTKAYTSQYLSLVMFAIVMAEDKVSKTPRIHQIINALKSLPDNFRTVLNMRDAIKSLAESLYEKKSMLLLGRGYQQATCLEGAFKMKEVANLQAEGILAGELKHGPLALIDKELPVIMFVMKDDTYDKCMNAVQQVTARQGDPVLICCEGDTETISHSKRSIAIPQTADCLQGILAIAPVQLLAMHITLLRKYDVDQPRNLVKAVTADDSKHYVSPQ